MRWPLIFIRFSGKKVAPKIIIFDHLLTFTEKLYKWQNLKVLFFTKKMLLPLNSFLLFGARRDNNDHNSTIVKSLTMQCSTAQWNIFPKFSSLMKHCRFLVSGNTQKILTEILHQFWHKNDGENICH